MSEEIEPKLPESAENDANVSNKAIRSLWTYIRNFAEWVKNNGGGGTAQVDEITWSDVVDDLFDAGYGSPVGGDDDEVESVFTAEADEDSDEVSILWF